MIAPGSAGFSLLLFFSPGEQNENAFSLVGTGMLEMVSEFRNMTSKIQLDWRPPPHMEEEILHSHAVFMQCERAAALQTLKNIARTLDISQMGGLG